MALSNAERQAKHREKLKAKGDALVVKMTRLTKRMGELGRQINELPVLDDSPKMQRLMAQADAIGEELEAATAELNAIMDKRSSAS